MFTELFLYVVMQNTTYNSESYFLYSFILFIPISLCLLSFGLNFQYEDTNTHANTSVYIQIRFNDSIYEKYREYQDYRTYFIHTANDDLYNYATDCKKLPHVCGDIIATNVIHFLSNEVLTMQSSYTNSKKAEEAATVVLAARTIADTHCCDAPLLLATLRAHDGGRLDVPDAVHILWSTAGCSVVASDVARALTSVAGGVSFTDREAADLLRELCELPDMADVVDAAPGEFDGMLRSYDQ
eukprot:gene29874-37270_t